MSTKRSVVGSIAWCHLCGMPIPNDIVDPTHPLFGTADHVVPVSRKGQNIWTNRRAAHRTCNQIKAARKGITIEEAEHQRKLVFKRLADLMFPVSLKTLTRARIRASKPSSETIDKKPKFRTQYRDWMRWADDGGSVLDDQEKNQPTQKVQKLPR